MPIRNRQAKASRQTPALNPFSTLRTRTAASNTGRPNDPQAKIIKEAVESNEETYPEPYSAFQAGEHSSEDRKYVRHRATSASDTKCSCGHQCNSFEELREHIIKKGYVFCPNTGCTTAYTRRGVVNAHASSTDCKYYDPEKPRFAPRRKAQAKNNKA
jgi:hypothetical protein